MIESFADLGDNWDGYGASAISERVRQQARQFVDIVEAALELLAIPDVAPTPSGTVSFEWASSVAEAYLEIGNTRYSGYIKTEQGPILLDGDVNSLDQQIVSVLEAYTSGAAFSTPTIVEVYASAPQHDLLAA
ncbi:MAG: hypothetical protein ACREFJ_10855 [Acetobacteraceae bacterium]